MSRERDNLLVVDLETTGVNPFRHDVTAAAFVPMADDLPPCEIYVRQESLEWSQYAAVNFKKYASQWNAGAVPARQACEKIEKYISEHFSSGSVTLIGHNVGFDIAFLRKLAFAGGREEFAGISHRAIDTHTLLYVLYEQGRLPGSVLSSDGAFKHFAIDVPEEERHTAIGDALATRELSIRLFEMLGIAHPRRSLFRPAYYRGVTR